MIQAFDFQRFFDPEYVSAMMSGCTVRDQYARGAGISYALDDGSARGVQEVVRLNDDMFLVLSDIACFTGAEQRQLVTAGDWIHFQFRLSGGGVEFVAPGRQVATDSRSCVLGRYTGNSIIARRNWDSPQWRAVCLYFRPHLVESFFGIPASTLPADWNWITDHDGCGAHAAAFPLSSLELVAASSLFGCAFRGDVRRSYMNAKAIELFTLAISRLVPSSDECETHLTTADAQRIARVRQILIDEMDRQLTLGQIGRRVGVNRSKLAAGFKSLYGSSVQSYWRELRLQRARELLAIDQLSVTEVAEAVGYADISSLTRSLKKRFGINPRDCKMRGAAGLG